MMLLKKLNHYWRIFAAGLCYLLFAVGAFVPAIYIFALALVPIDKESKQRRVRNVIQRLCRFYMDLMQFLGLMTYEVSGPKPKPLSGHLVICNHTMLIDALFGLAYVENLCCVVKAALCQNPFTRLPIKLAGYIANNDPRLVDIAADKLERGENILIFPEGTRNSYDLQLDFKRGAANIAVISDAPILPIVLCCMPRALCKGMKWYAIPFEKSKVVMQFKPVLRVSDCINTTEPRTRQYRNLTQWLRDYYYKAVSAIVGV